VPGLAAITLTGAFGSAQAATTALSAVTPQLIAIKDSLPATTDGFTVSWALLGRRDRFECR
jgi:hypothetical protein